MRVRSMNSTLEIVARLIKSDPVLSPTRLVLLTGYPARGQAALAQEAGIDAYLQKPIREAPLRSTIEMLLGGGHASVRPLLTGRRFEYRRQLLQDLLGLLGGLEAL